LTKAPVVPRRDPAQAPAGPATPLAGRRAAPATGHFPSASSTSTNRSRATSTRPTPSASRAARTTFATFATLLHDSDVRPFSIDIDPSSDVPQDPDSWAEPSLNSARSTSIVLPSAGFDSRRLHDFFSYDTDCLDTNFGPCSIAIAIFLYRQRVEQSRRVPPRTGAEVRIPHRHFDRRVPE